GRPAAICFPKGSSCSPLSCRRRVSSVWTQPTTGRPGWRCGARSWAGSSDAGAAGRPPRSGAAYPTSVVEFRIIVAVSQRPTLVLHLLSYTAVTGLGRGNDALAAALAERRSALAPCRFETVRLETMVAEVRGLEDVGLRPDLAAFDCRNNRLAQLTLEQDGLGDAVRTARERYGADRIGVFVGTSTSGILETEIAYRHRDPSTGALPAALDYRRTHNSYSVADFVRCYFELRGPASAVCTACSSGAKAFGSARRMLEAALIDAAVVGGVDTLCLTTLYGFHSLEVLSAETCRPFDPERSGISIGEGAAFALLGSGDADVALLGAGESSDAHHMSAPHPEGLGARAAMQAALHDARLAADAVDYINLHGTATPANDATEALAVTALFGSPVACSSTKGAA